MLGFIPNLPACLITLASSPPKQGIRKKATEINQKKESENFSKDFVSCKRIDQLTDKYNEKEVNYIGKRILSDLPEDLHNELLNKEAGDTLNPRIIGENINIILICDRKDDIGIQVSRETIEENIYAQKIGMMSRRYLRDLRRDAVIEYR